MEPPTKGQPVRVLTRAEIEALRQEMQADGEAMRQMLDKQHPAKQPTPQNDS